MNTWVNGQSTANVTDQRIGMRIYRDRISLTGNSLQGIDDQMVCQIGSIEFARKTNSTLIPTDARGKRLQRSGRTGLIISLQAICR